MIECMVRHTCPVNRIGAALHCLLHAGMEEEGIFRVPGDNGQITKLQHFFENGTDPLGALEGVECPFDCHTIASCLKLYFRTLDEPVMTFQYYAAFVATATIDDDAEKLAAVRELVYEKIPEAHRRVLDILIPFLQRVAAKSDVNKMTMRNLAVVFGPSLLHTVHEDTMALLRDSASVICVLLHMIEHWDDIRPPAEVSKAATRPVLVLDRDDGDDAAAPGALTRVDSDEWV
eukprot:m.432845 g.432845  ORF g.432845 m.432845 type:complete len:232 (+) comp21415_c0_seq3:1524-2219(+)